MKLHIFCLSLVLCLATSGAVQAREHESPSQKLLRDTIKEFENLTGTGSAIQSDPNGGPALVIQPGTKCRVEMGKDQLSSLNAEAVHINFETQGNFTNQNGLQDFLVEANEYPIEATKSGETLIFTRNYIPSHRGQCAWSETLKLTPKKLAEYSSSTQCLGGRGPINQFCNF